MKLVGNGPKMTVKFKRFLSGFLAVLMVLGAIPTTTFVSEAAGSATNGSYSVVAEVNGQPQVVTATGIDGANKNYFVVEMPEKVGSAKWVSWKTDGTIAAINGGGEYATYAVTSEIDGRKMTFVMKNGDTSDFAASPRTTISFAGGCYVTTYNVTADGAVESVNHGKTYTVPSTTSTTAAPEGQVLLGWKDGDNKTYQCGQQIIITNDLTLTPVFGYDNQYVVVFQDGCGNVLSSAVLTADEMTGTADASNLKPANPAREGYTFTSWDTDDTVLAAISGNTVVTAQWSANTYSVSYGATDKLDQDASTILGNKAVGETVSVTVAAQTGYTLEGVSVTDVAGKPVAISLESFGSSSITFNFQMPASNVKITPAFRAGAHTVKYFVNGSLYDTQSYAHGDTLKQLAVPAKDGYTGGVWVDKTTKTEYAADATVTADLELEAKYDTKSTYQVTTAVAGDTPDDAKVTLNKTQTAEYAYDEVVELTVSVPEGYALKNITAANTNDPTQMVSVATIKDSAKYSFRMPAYDVTVTATFVKVEAGSHVVKFVVDGSLYDLNTVKDNAVITAPAADPEKEGYTFKGWAKEDGAKLESGVTTATADAVYTAQFSVNEYKVTVNVTPDALANDVTVSDTTFDYGKAFVLTVPDKEGYVVKSVTASYGNHSLVLTAVASGTYTVNMPAGDVTIQVAYEAIPEETALVKFMVDGVLYDYQMVAKGSSAKVSAADPTKEGYEFIGWTGNGATNKIFNNDAYTVAKDAADVITYTANWDAKSYKVSYDPANGDASSNESVVYGKAVTLPKAPTKDGSEFLGWKSSQTNIIYEAGAEYTVTGAVTFTAQWSTSKYVVKFVDADTKEVFAYDEVNSGDTVTAPSPEKTGYTLTKWVDAANTNSSVVAGETVKVTKTVTFEAVWEKQSYSITASGSNCTVKLSKDTAEYNEKVSFNVTADDKYVVDMVYITYTVNGTTEVKVLTAANGGYEFVMPGAKVQITAIAKQNVYTVQQAAGNHTTITCKSTDVEVGKGVTFTVDADEYYMVGNVYVEAADGTMIPVSKVLDDQNKPEYHFTMPAQNVTIHSQAVESDATYTIKYMVDGSLYNVDHVKVTTVIKVPADPTKEGYVFEGWYDDADNKLNDNSKAIADVTYTARFTAKSYKVTVDVTPAECGSEVTTANTAECGKLVTVRINTPATYVLKNVKASLNGTGEGIILVPSNAEGVYTFTMPAGDVTIAVEYEKIPDGMTLVKYMVDGDLYDYQIVAKGSIDNVVAAADPVAEGKEFLGWSKDGNNLISAGGTFSISTSAADVITYNAYWKTNQYTVSYAMNGGTPDADSETVDYGKKVVLPAAPTKEGYTFAGWKSDQTNTLYNAGAKYTVTANVKFTATWASSEYVIKFVDGETGIVYGYEAVSHGTKVTAPSPVRTGYTLKNWIDKAGNTVDPEEEFTATASVIYTAVWEKQRFQVTSAGTNCTVEPATQEKDYNDAVSFRVTPDADYAVDMVYITYTVNGTTEMKVLTADANGAYHFCMPGANVQITATAKKTIYQISTSAGTNTSIDCAVTEAKVGTDVTFTVASTSEDYTVGNVYVEAADGSKIAVAIVLDAAGNAEYHFTMPEQNVTIKSQAVQGEYTVTYLDSDNTLLSQETVKAGEKVNMMAAPTAPAGYVFKGWELLKDTNHTLYTADQEVTVKADMYLKATYEGVENKVTAGVADNIYLLKVDQGKDMSNSVDLLSNRANYLKAKNGTTVYFQVSADYNWKISDITITSADGNTDLAVTPTLIAKSQLTGAADEDQNGNDLYTYAFTMPAESVVINVYTEAREYRVSVKENIPAAGDYTINGYTTTNHLVAQGSTVEIAVTPADGYTVESVEGTYTNKAGNIAHVLGSYDDATGIYTFPMVAFDVTVDITYVANKYNVDVTTSNAATYDPQITGTPGTALELEDHDNKGYVALLDGMNSEMFEDPDMDGTYTPANAKFQVGDQVKFVVKSYRGWVFDSVTVTYAGGTKSCQLTQKNGVYYFTMPAADDVQITANFVKDTYTVTKKVVGENHGTILVNGLTENRISSAYKDLVNVEVTPDAGYYVKSIRYELTDNTANDFSAAANYASADQSDVLDTAHTLEFITPSSPVTVIVEYGKVDYTLTTAVNGNGDLTLSADDANVGDLVEIITAPAYGYKLVKLEVETISGKKVAFTENNTESENTTGSYYFTMPAEAVEVTATFQKVDYVVTYVNEQNAVIAMEGVTYKETADVAGHVSDVVTAPVGQHFVGWVSKDVETAVTTPSVNNADFVVVKDTMIVASFAYDDTDVIFKDTVNGTVTAEGQHTSPEFTLNKKYNDQISFTAEPDAGYEIDTVKVTTFDKDGNPVEVSYTETVDAAKVGTYKFTIPATRKADVHKTKSTDVVVTVTFKKSAYVLTQAEDCGTNGTVAVNGQIATQKSFDYAYNDQVTIKATPDTGYYVKSIVASYVANGDTKTFEINGAVPAADTAAGDAVTLEFNMPAYDVTYKVVYEKIDYTITRVYTATQGTVETFNHAGLAIDQAQIGDKVDIKVTPKKGYALKSLTVTYDNGTQSVVITGTADNEFTFTMPAKAVTVTAVFTEVNYTARLTKTGQGNVTLNTYFTENMNADYLDTVTVNAEPAEGWHLVSITVTGDAEVGNVAVSPAIAAEGGDYTFTMPNCNVKVDVVFAKNDYSIQVVNDPVQGTVVTTPASTAQIGDVIKVKVTPNQGYQLDDLTVTYADGEKSVALTKISDNNYTFTMPAADVTVTAVYKTVTYEVTLDQTGEGTVRLNGYNTKKLAEQYKDTVTVEITPATGWELKSVTVNDGAVEVTPEVAANGGEYTFTMPNQDAVVSVVLEKSTNNVTTYAVNAHEDGHGTITMNSDAGQVGDRMTITADPDNGYRVKHVVVTDKAGNSVPVFFVSEGIDNLETWSFTMPASEVEVKVIFEVYAASYFTDCRTDDWYYEAVTYLTDKGLITGITDDLFGPDVYMTREMFVAIIARMEGINVDDWANVDTEFTDVRDGAWYVPYLAWAKANNIVNGYGDETGEFGIGDPITREQMFVMMYRYADLKGMDMSVTYPEFMDEYADADQISAYAYDALVWCVSEGIAKGMQNKTINPKAFAPRSHAAQMFKNYMDYTFYR